MLKTFAIVLLSVLVAIPSSEWQKVTTVEGKVTSVRVDGLNSFYLIRKGTIEKYDLQGKMFTQYSNKLIGEGLLVDVTNPLKVLLYSPAQMKVFFLDSRLGELRNPLSMLDLGYDQVTLAASSHSNGFWIYDAINFELIRYDQNLEVLQRSVNLAQLLRLEFYPNYLVEVNDRLYLNDPDHGVFVFDIFGNYLKRLPILGLERLAIGNNQLFYPRGNVLYATQLRTLEESVVDLPYSEGAAFDFAKALAAIEGKEAVNIFRPKQ